MGADLGDPRVGSGRLGGAPGQLRLGLDTAGGFCAVGFLVVTVPLPVPVVHGIEQGLQHATAAVVEAVFRISHVTYSRDAKALSLDGLRFEVARGVAESGPP